MIHIGIVRKIDKEGRVVIPKEYRKLYNMKENEPVYIIGTENGILISAPDFNTIKQGIQNNL